jgi:hypothetical protein
VSPLIIVEITANDLVISPQTKGRTGLGGTNDLRKGSQQRSGESLLVDSEPKPILGKERESGSKASAPSYPLFKFPNSVAKGFPHTVAAVGAIDNPFAHLLSTAGANPMGSSAPAGNSAQSPGIGGLGTSSDGTKALSEILSKPITGVSGTDNVFGSFLKSTPMEFVSLSNSYNPIELY